MNLQEAKKLLEKFGANGLRDLFHQFKEINPDDLCTLNPRDYNINNKWDGWYTSLLVENKIGTIYSRTKKYRENLDCNGMEDNVYFGELIENTQWSYNFCGGIYHGQLMIFDKLNNTIELEHIDIVAPPWIERVITYTSDNLKRTFDDVIDQGFEGMVLINKKTNERFKVKKIIEDDFEILGFEISESDTAKKAGGLIKNFIYGKNGKRIGKYSAISEDLKKDMFKNPKKYINRIVKISGKEQFKSGALRHPNSIEFRDEADKGKI